MMKIMKIPFSPLASRLGAFTLALHCLQCATPSPAPAPPRQAGAPLSAADGAPPIRVSPQDAERIGKQIWRNESAGAVAGLTSWNSGETFASMGIGHFIWYPASVPQTYQESFRPLLAFLQYRGVSLPAGLTPAASCPWPDRASFQAAAQGTRMTAIRNVLANTIGLQTEFIIRRMQMALPKMLQSAPPRNRQRIARQFHALSETPNGLYALIDYVNFKGEGVNPKERYQHQGWGLLQVLQGMRGEPRGQAAAQEFAASAKRTLARRIANAPKNESQWRAGWFRRCDTYARPW